MAKINSVVDESTRILLREITKSHKNGVIRTWKKRKVISVEKWKELPRTDSKIKLRYFPEDYVDYPWPFAPEDEIEARQIAEWFHDWKEYLYEKEKPLFGEYLCRNCILHHDSGKYNSSIRDLVLLGSDKSLKHPCDTENIFKCPFLPKGPSAQLFDLQAVSSLVIDSLQHALSLSQNNKITVIGYFARDFCMEYMDPLHPKPTAGGPLFSTLEMLHPSDVMIDSIQDIYNVLTSEELLTVVIDQHIRDIRNHTPESKIELADYLDTIKPKAISYFREIQDMIKIEEIYDFAGRNLEEEREEKQRVQEIYRPRDGELVEDIPRSGLCIKCQGFANIKCANCEIWVCVKHWKVHAIDIHGYKFTK